MNLSTLLAAVTPANVWTASGTEFDADAARMKAHRVANRALAAEQARLR